MTEEQQQSRRARRLRALWIVAPLLVLAVLFESGFSLAGFFETLFRGLDALFAPGEAAAPQPAPIAALFSPEVDYWQEDIQRWAADSGLAPNLIATVIQIESCGHPGVASSAGAQGLFQVMPFHFAEGENALDANTNARTGLRVLAECLQSPYNPEQDVGLALACYNGGPSVFVYPQSRWPQESRYYYTWSTALYAEAQAGQAESATLAAWLAAGGARLCAEASAVLGLD